MSIKYYYLHVSLQAKDTFFGNLKQLYPCSLNLTDPFPVRVLLEVERRYGKKLALEHVDKLSILLAYFVTEPPLSLHPMRVQYVGMDGSDTRNGSGLQAKHFFQLGDHVEQRELNLVEEVEFHQSFNGEVLDGLQIHYVYVYVLFFHYSHLPYTYFSPHVRNIHLGWRLSDLELR
ncbi:hypothetical protein EDD18DRAFT_1112179 [Armillaria luteobubalina]|uniref:Uncharacterized protein n=1 Tax=Armillaria luteobubalina TaxID=153913 RepID=A0AA39PH42_9AGAR|nr:hypothetical protein EDD18DRAFT_1112179 [Armillaria luteobubalina]